jgi:hypothetical protein
LGRTALELTKSCNEVVALDYSQRFVDSANELVLKGCLNYERIDEGELVT